VSVALGILHAVRMRQIAMRGLTALQRFSILSHINGRIFANKKAIESKICVSVFYAVFP